MDPTQTSGNRYQLVRYAWVVLALLWPVAMLNYLDRQMLSSMKTSVMADIPSIHLEANWGYTLGQFKWVYAVLSPIGGYISDRFSRKYAICLSLVVWSGVTWLTGRATTLDQMIWARSLMGVSEAFYIPAALALITEYHQGETRAKAVGIHQTAIYAGIILGGFSGYAADAPSIGWRSAFAWVGLIGAVYAVPLWLLLRDSPRKGVVEKLSPGVAAATLARNVSFWLLVFYFTLPALAGWVVRDWMPAILKDQFKLGQGAAGVSATLYVNVASLIGVFLAGWLSDRAVRRNARGRIWVSSVGMVLLVPALFGVGDAGSLGVAVAFLVLFGVAWGLYDCNNMPILSQIVSSDKRATAYGFMNLVSIGSGGLSVWFFGVLRDRHEPINLIFAAFTIPIIVSVALVLCIKPDPTLAK